MDVQSILIRCSSLGKIMGVGKNTGLTDTQKKELQRLSSKEKLTDNQKETLKSLIFKRDNAPEFDISEGAKSYIKHIVKREVLDYTIDIESKYLSKGTLAEQDSIDLYNEVYFSNLKKNDVRLYNEYIQGECDILGNDIVIDIKTSWSKDTFPMLPEEGYNSDYEWQLRGYMMLYNVSNARLSYCLVDTPDELLDYENNTTIHFIDDEIPKSILVTSIDFERDFEKEEQIKYKVNECRKFASWYYSKILEKCK